MPITIAPGFFSPDDEWFDGGWEADPRFVVKTSDVAAAAEALAAASPRMARVGESGREWPVDEDPAAQEDWTPNYVREVHVDDRGALLSADTKGWVSEGTAQTMFRILREELDARGVDGEIAYDDRYINPDARPWVPRQDA